MPLLSTEQVNAVPMTLCVVAECTSVTRSKDVYLGGKRRFSAQHRIIGLRSIKRRAGARG